MQLFVQRTTDHMVPSNVVSWMLYIITFLFIYMYISLFSILLQSIHQCISSPWMSPAIASQQYQSTSSWQPTAVVQETLILSATESCGFMYFICSVYNVWHYKISNKIKKAETQIMNVNWLVSIFRITKSILFCNLL